jgi:hypothetical protein
MLINPLHIGTGLRLAYPSLIPRQAPPPGIGNRQPLHLDQPPPRPDGPPLRGREWLVRGPTSIPLRFPGAHNSMFAQLSLLSLCPRGFPVHQAKGLPDTPLRQNHLRVPIILFGSPTNTALRLLPFDSQL